MNWDGWQESRSGNQGNRLRLVGIPDWGVM